MTHNYYYERVICTGLGDRMGMLLALAAVARVYNLTSITMRWCTDPMHAQWNNPMHLTYIPQWKGYDYTLEAMHAHLSLPEGVRVAMYDEGVDRALRARKAGDASFLGWVTDNGAPGVVPAIQGLPFLPWLGHDVFMVSGRRRRPSRRRFEAAYAAAARELRVVVANASGAMIPVFDVVVHLRAWDANTAGHVDYAEQHFCTRAALERLVERTPHVAVLSHNRTWARRVLGKKGLRKYLLRAGTVWRDFQVLLSARRGIVQHASEGWSAFSSVAALARGLPLLNTYMGVAEHRLDFFARFGAVPAHWHRCGDMDTFMASL